MTPDADGDPGPNFGAYFTEGDYARVPRRDLMPMAPRYAGDDSWGRSALPPRNDCGDRPSPDDGVSLWLAPPQGHGSRLRYRHKNGALFQTTNESGDPVAPDGFGIPV